jgi:hypothetical protein
MSKVAGVSMPLSHKNHFLFLSELYAKISIDSYYRFLNLDIQSWLIVKQYLSK